MREEILKIAVCQLRTEKVYEQTMEKTERMIRQAVRQGAQAVCLPEMFYCPYARGYFRDFARRGAGEALETMARWARENEILLVGGSVPEIEGEKLYNTSFVFDPQGRQIARHRKAHLFDVDLPGMRFRESDTFTPGDAVTTFDTPWGTMGVAVCFDIRFPELFRAMAVRGARVIFLPAQFNMTTGPAHWELSLRARAVDNELFVVGASAARNQGFDYECWGHSLVADPFGSVIAQADESEQLLLAELDLSRVDQVRGQLPTFLHLRRELYEVAK